MKALNFELENDDINYRTIIQRKNSLCDEIIREAELLSSSTTFGSFQSLSTQNTLQLEHIQLGLNLRSDISISDVLTLHVLCHFYQDV